jgi:hypothetical protein
MDDAVIIEINLNVKFQPIAFFLFFVNACEKEFPGIHQARKNDIVILRDVSDFNAVRGPDGDCAGVVGVVGLAEKIEFVAGVQVRFQIHDALDMGGAGDMRFKEVNFTFKRLWKDRVAALAMDKADQTALIARD